MYAGSPTGSATELAIDDFIGKRYGKGQVILKFFCYRLQLTHRTACSCHYATILYILQISTLLQAFYGKRLSDMDQTSLDAMAETATAAEKTLGLADMKPNAILVCGATGRTGQWVTLNLLGKVSRFHSFECR
jgi:hypothetical protein